MSSILLPLKTSTAKCEIKLKVHDERATDVT